MVTINSIQLDGVRTWLGQTWQDLLRFLLKLSTFELRHASFPFKDHRNKNARKLDADIAAEFMTLATSYSAQ